MTTQRNPWPALYAMVVGFFMILLDMTIVSVANPAIKIDLNTSMNNVIWVTSSYLLAYAVPLLVTGRLGDRFGPKNLYLAGLAVFTLSSLWCGLASTIGVLIVARAVQGLGAALITPQTMAVITRTFPPDKRGPAMGLWGGVAGLATLVGPILGGVLVDHWGWQWIFMINVPIGVVAFALAVWLVPTLPTHTHRFDLVGVALSGTGMFLLVFGIQEGNDHHWNSGIWALIIGGLAAMAVFVVHQSRTQNEPLVPLVLFRDRNFTLSSLAIAAMGASVVGLMVPTYFYLEAVREYSPTKAALVFAPMAIITGVIAPGVGKISDKLHPALLPAIGFGLFSAVLFGFSALMTPAGSIPMFVLLGSVAGISNAFIWAPLAAVATRNLPMQLAGAGSGIYNTTRQIGSVLGSASISALLTSRLNAQGLNSAGMGEGSKIAHMPPFIAAKFSTALSEATMLPAAILLIGMLASALFARPKVAAAAAAPVTVDAAH